MAKTGVPARTRERVIEDIWTRVDRWDPDECWWWRGWHNDRGYSYVRWEDRDQPVYRVLYSLLVGPIPIGTEMDHLCRNPGCVNPKHVEPVSHETNFMRGYSPPAKNARKTHCISGHLLDEENVYLRFGGWRACRECKRQRDRGYKARKREGHARNL